MVPDLLTPVLTADDDAVGFDRPWNPWYLVMVAFFFGMLAGGGLLAVNFRRLGQGRRFGPAAAVVLATTVALIAGWLLLEPRTGSSRALYESLRIGRRAVAVLVAIGLATLQRRRFRLLEVCDLPAGMLLGPAVLAIALGLGGEFLIALALTVAGAALS